MKKLRKMYCPFCKEEVTLLVTDDEGNIHNQEYAKNPWSGLGYILYHPYRDGENMNPCPIKIHEYEPLGSNIYDTPEEAVDFWYKTLGKAKQYGQKKVL